MGSNLLDPDDVYFVLINEGVLNLTVYFPNYNIVTSTSKLRPPWVLLQIQAVACLLEE
jgi:hypothetical protein